MSILKSFVSLFPGGENLARRFSYYRRGRKLARIGDTEDRFTYIYEHNKWQNPESVSGAGSSLWFHRKHSAGDPALARGLRCHPNA